MKETVSEIRTNMTCKDCSYYLLGINKCYTNIHVVSFPLPMPCSLSEGESSFCSVTLYQERFLHMSNHAPTDTPKQAQPSSGQAPAWIILFTKEWSVSGQLNEMRWACPFILPSRLRRCAQMASWTESLATLLLMNLSLLLHGFPSGTLSLASFQMYDPLGLYIRMSCSLSRLCY